LRQVFFFNIFVLRRPQNRFGSLFHGTKFGKSLFIYKASRRTVWVDRRMASGYWFAGLLVNGQNIFWKTCAAVQRFPRTPHIPVQYTGPRQHDLRFTRPL
jgi:hypothetical protein